MFQIFLNSKHIYDIKINKYEFYFNFKLLLNVFNLLNIF